MTTATIPDLAGVQQSTSTMKAVVFRGPNDTGRVARNHQEIDGVRESRITSGQVFAPVQADVLKRR